VTKLGIGVQLLTELLSVTGSNAEAGSSVQLKEENGGPSAAAVATVTALASSMRAIGLARAPPLLMIRDLT